MTDRLLIYPRTSAKGLRGASEPVEGTAVPEVGAVRPDELDRMPVREVLETDRRFGRMGGTILLNHAPAVAVEAGWRIEHVGRNDQYGDVLDTFAVPERWVAMGRAIPPSSNVARWTIAVQRDD